jgi:hypothetical protein
MFARLTSIEFAWRMALTGGAFFVLPLRIELHHRLTAELFRPPTPWKKLALLDAADMIRSLKIVPDAKAAFENR